MMRSSYMPVHTPSPDLLAEYASGTASPATALFVASHLTYAPGSRSDIALLEEIGGAVLAEEVQEPMSARALNGLFAAIDAIPGVAPVARPAETLPGGYSQADGILPRPVQNAIQMPLDSIPWKFRLPGVSEYELDGFGDEKVSILRARPGSAVPQHTHNGREMTLVMTGAMQDGERILRAGDCAIHDEEDDHRPQIIGDDTCYCLIVMDGGLRFTGRFSRALNLFSE